MSRKLKIVFLGTTAFAVPALDQLVAAGHEVLAVVCQPDRPNQRGKKIRILPVKERAIALNIPVMQPQRIRDPENEAALNAFGADLFVVAAYGQILSQAILDIPPMGCINIHGSLLPAYRGAAPIQRAIIDGCTETGITIMQLDAGMDTGDMLSKCTVSIHDQITADELENVLAEKGAALLVKTIEGLLDGSVKPEKQDHSIATYAEKLDRDTGRIQWQQQSHVILRLINGTTPQPGAYTLINNEKLKCFGPEIVADDSEAAPGTVLFANSKQGFIVKTGDGALRLKEIQMPGKKRMKAIDYFRGNAIPVGTVLTD